VKKASEPAVVESQNFCSDANIPMSEPIITMGARTHCYTYNMYLCMLPFKTTKTVTIVTADSRYIDLTVVK
jgi:hypothetical protein